MPGLKDRFNSFFITPTNIAPLAVLRMAFGSIMLVSTVRFILKGWINAYYVKPLFHFTFYGFNWVKPFSAAGMYALFAVLVAAAIFIIIGLFYRVAIVTYFTCFTYVELIDKTTYLNHYYFISVMAFLLIWVPAERYFSMDVWRKPSLMATTVPGWCINIFKLQLLLVYFFAGISKLNCDWLIDAMPLKIWLPGSAHIAIVDVLLSKTWVAYAFSWFGAAFDLFIGFLLLNAKTRKPAYVLVVLFHLATGLLFNIGMFPYIMIFVTIIFFSAQTHVKIISFLRHSFKLDKIERIAANFYQPSTLSTRVIATILIAHFALQLILPLRYLCYPGKLYWTEEGYRFSWRVMLMEKGGTAYFRVKDPKTGKRFEVINQQYLTEFQEKMMSTQPDMILQYAHFLATAFEKQGIKNPIVTAESYVNLNGGDTRLYIDSTVNLATQQETMAHKKWILPFNPQQK